MTYDIEMNAFKLMSETGLSARELAELDMSDYARLTGRQTPAEAAMAALDAEYERRQQSAAPQPPQAPPAAQSTPQAQQEQPPGIDVMSMDMQAYAQIRGQLGVQGREYGRGALDGGSTQNWIAAAQHKIGRTSYGQSNVQEAARPDSSKYLTANEPVAGRTAFYR